MSEPLTRDERDHLLMAVARVVVGDLLAVERARVAEATESVERLTRERDEAREDLVDWLWFAQRVSDVGRGNVQKFADDTEALDALAYEAETLMSGKVVGRTCPSCEEMYSARGGMVSDGSVPMCYVCYWKSEAMELSKERDALRETLSQVRMRCEVECIGHIIPERDALRREVVAWREDHDKAGLDGSKERYAALRAIRAENEKREAGEEAKRGPSS